MPPVSRGTVSSQLACKICLYVNIVILRPLFFPFSHPTARQRGTRREQGNDNKKGSWQQDRVDGERKPREKRLPTEHLKWLMTHLPLLHCVYSNITNLLYYVAWEILVSLQPNCIHPRCQTVTRDSLSMLLKCCQSVCKLHRHRGGLWVSTAKSMEPKILLRAGVGKS